MKGYMIWNSDVEFEYDGATYLATYKTDAISGRSWVSAIENNVTGESVPQEQAVAWPRGAHSPTVAESDEWAELHPLAKAAMEKDIEQKQDRSCT